MPFRFNPAAPDPIRDDALTGRVAVVTGGGGGIGEVICEFLASRGARVGVLDVDPDAAKTVAATLQEDGFEAMPIHADLADIESTVAGLRTLREAFGPVSVLVNNATSAGDKKFNLIADHPDPFAGSTVDVDLKGMIVCCREVWADLVEQGSGRIVNVVSSAAYRGAPYIGVYAAAKNGMIALSRVLAAEGAPYGITSNCVEPGFTATRRLMEEGVATAFEDDFDHPNWDLGDRQRELGVWDGIDDEDTAKFMRMMGIMAADMGVLTTPARPVYPEEVAGAVAYLVGPDSASVTGTTINVNGGMVMP